MFSASTSTKKIFLIASITFAVFIGFAVLWPHAAFAVDGDPPPADPLPPLSQDLLLTAGQIASLPGELALSVVNGFIYVGFIFTGWLADVAGTLAQAAIEHSVEKLSDVSIVEDGWKLSRDMANLFFIFVLLVIAIATILRRETYGMKALLPTLIIVALFINFSLTITQFIIQPTNYLSLYFLDNIKQDTDGGNFHTAIKDAVYMSSVLKVTTEENSAAGSTGFFGTVLRTTATPIQVGFLLYDYIHGEGGLEKEAGAALLGLAGIVFFLVIIFVFLAIAVLTTIRTIVLMALMILAPLAFLLQVLPATSGYARRWWSALFKQSLFLPGMLFLVWLAVRMSDKIGVAAGRNEAILDSLSLLYSFILVIGFLVAALYFAKELGAAGAGAAISWGRTARTYATGAIGGVSTYYTTRYAAEKIAKSKVSKQLAGESQLYGGIQKRLEEYARPRTEVSERQIGYQEKAMMGLPREKRAEYINAHPELQKAIIKSWSPQNIAAMIESASEIDDKSKQAKRDLIHKIEESLLKTDAEKYGKYLEERGKIGLQDKNITEFGRIFKDLDQQSKEAVIRVSKTEDLWRLAQATSEGEKRNLIAFIHAANKEKARDLVYAMPRFAEAIGEEIKDIIPRIDYAKIQASEMSDAGVMNATIRYANTKQRRILIERSDNVSKEYLRQMKDFSASAEGAADALEALGTKAVATKLRLDKEFRQLHGYD